MQMRETLIITWNGIPMFVPARNATRQLMIELWFDGDKVLKELGIKKKRDPRKSYVV